MAHILVVDDDRDILRLVQKLLEGAGHLVVTCDNPLDALERWKTEAFDLVLTDANMPHINGFDLVKTLSQNARGLGTAVALLTGRREKRDVERGLLSGADDYLLKPIDPDIFLSKIENLINKKAAQVLQIQFTEASTHIKAEWEVKTVITQLSEQGMTLLSPILGVKNAKIKIHSRIFAEIGLEPPILRVMESIPNPSGSHMFFTKVSFVGVSDTDLQKIRFWINQALSQGKVGRAA